MFEVEDFYGCCTARTIAYWQGFPNVNTAYGSDGKRYDISTYEGYKVFATKEMLRACEDLNEEREDGGDKYEDLRDNGIIFAAFRSDQVNPITFAKEVGFRVTRKAKKGHNPDTDLIGAFCDSKDLYKWYIDNKDK